MTQVELVNIVLIFALIMTIGVAVTLTVSAWENDKTLFNKLLKVWSWIGGFIFLCVFPEVIGFTIGIGFLLLPCYLVYKVVTFVVTFFSKIRHEEEKYENSLEKLRRSFVPHKAVGGPQSRQEALAWPSPPPLPPPLPPKAKKAKKDYRCPNCGSGIGTESEISPSGDIKCSHCKSWFNVN